MKVGFFGADKAVERVRIKRPGGQVSRSMDGGGASAGRCRKERQQELDNINILAGGHGL